MYYQSWLGCKQQHVTFYPSRTKPFAEFTFLFFCCVQKWWRQSLHHWVESLITDVVRRQDIRISAPPPTNDGIFTLLW